MPHEIRVPRLGWSMEEGKFVGWLAQPGAEVNVGDPLFELESDKALEPVDAIDAGRLHIPPDAPPPGSAVQVGTLLGYLLAAGEPPPIGPAGAAALIPSGAVPSTFAEVAPPEREPALRAGARPVASPRARRIAAALGVDWTTLHGTGRGGRVREADVRAARSGSSTPAPLPLSPRRRAIADHLRAAWTRSVPVTLTSIADASDLVALRDGFKAAGGLVPAYTDFVACLAARVLIDHPAVASRWDETGQALLPASADAIDIGIAVETPDGLLVPVVRDVARRSPTEVAADSIPLIDRARRGRLTAAELQGGVFTITNLGAYRIDAFTPILNAPQVAILGLGMIRREPVVTPDGRIEPRHLITLSLTFDHAALDGATAAAFLRDLASAIETPTSLLP